MSRTISEALHTQSRRTADINKRIVSRYLGGGIWILRKLGCTKLGFASAGQGSASYAPGTSVNIAQIQGSNDHAIVSLPPPSRRGASAFPVSTLGSGSLDALAIMQAAPMTVPRGSIGAAVALTGSGFAASPVDLITAVFYDVPSRTFLPDPYVTVTSVTFISDTEIHILINVSSTCPVGYKPKFRAERG